ncbi:MAG TPA: aminotransferase class I/II-fold pyridoxal phosphate-dependent enzyme, partial [Polyangia bacterium]
MQPFKLERYFAEHEFSAPFLLSASDCESLSLQELLALADPEARRLWDGLSLGYTESPGHTRLRQAIAGLYTSAGPDDVLVAAPEEAIFIYMQTLLAPGDEVVAVAPAYQSLHEVARSLGCRVLPWQLALTSLGWHVDLDLLEFLLNDRTRLLVLNFPHNPTGCLPSLAEFAAILALAERRGIYVFSDEMYRLLEYDPALRLPPACDLYERATSLGGMSKSLALPGLRIGWLASRAPGLRARWQEYKDYTTICSSAPSEILALMGLNARPSILARNLEIIRANLELAEAFFARHAGLFRWLPPQAGSVAFPAWLGGGVEQFCARMVERQGVMVVPGSMFDFPGQHFRLGLGRRNFPEALER